ncbi:MAG: CbiX/SirB N-terminal domain-containing protein [Propionibacteriaceae bacterium]|nr:CbiX/SirB N-terminal domain-containing protein [Propionibacteriaceae bacterium]
MTAPTLVMAARGSRDHRVARTAKALQVEMRRVRPEVDTRIAFLDSCNPTLPQVLEQLAGEGRTEAAIVPLDLTHATDVDPRFGGMVAHASRQFPQLHVGVARPVGPEASLLTVLDKRLRSSLTAARVLELDGLILSAATAGDVRGAALIARRARQWSTHHRLPCLTAVADGSGPSVAQALAGLRSQGRRHIAVGSFFLAADERWAVQAEQARRLGAVAVSDPLGSATEVAELVLARYAFAAMDLLPFDDEGNFQSDDAPDAAPAAPTAAAEQFALAFSA